MKFVSGGLWIQGGMQREMPELNTNIIGTTTKQQTSLFSVVASYMCYAS